MIRILALALLIPGAAAAALYASFAQPSGPHFDPVLRMPPKVITRPLGRAAY